MSERAKPDFQSLFEAVPGLYLVLLPDAPRYTIAAVSDAYARATLTRREELLGRGFFEVFPDNPLSASLGRVLATRVPDAMAPRKYDIRRPAESGGTFEERWWSARNSPVFGPRSEVAYIIHALEDVTERHHLEEQRQLHEQLLARARELFNQASDSIFIADLKGRFTDVNATACKLLGYAREELIGKAISDIIPPEDVPRLAATREYLLSPGTVELGEWTLLKSDRTPIPVEVSASILPDGRWQAFARDISERRRVERALQESEERFQLTIDEAPIGMSLVALDGRFVRVNRVLCEIVGYSATELMGLTFQAITHPDDLDADLALAAQLARGEIPRYQLEKRYVRKDGTVVDVLLSASLLRNRDGVPLYRIVQIQDITGRKHTDEELKDANASLDAIVENIPLMLFMKEAESLKFVRFNRAGEELLGWPRHTLIGKNDYDLWPEAQAEFFVAKDRETLQAGETVDIPEEPIQTRHQGVRILHTKKVPILNRAGHPIYLLGISEDVTERSRLEKELRFLAQASVALSASLDYDQTMARVAQLIVQNLADWCAVDVMDEHGQLRRLKVVSADPGKAALCAVLEQMPPDRGLPHVMGSVVESRRSLVVEHVTSAYLESLAQAPEHLQALLDTGVRSLIVVPLLIRGRALGALALASSTPSRTYGQADLRLADALADRAAVAIENARLYQAAISATELRDQVLGVVAHDLRNPLAAILLQSSILQRVGPEPERRSQDARDAIHRAATRMNRMIQDLLDVALMEAGQLTIERARLSPRELVVEAVGVQRSLATSASLELRMEVGANLPAVSGDRERLLQVFENLIGNAIKFTTAGGCITVGAASRDHKVVFWVADTGSGIAFENLPRVFDRFWQATKVDRQGAGLGLPITKGIVEAHGGRIWVESTLGQGTTVFFTIPQYRHGGDGTALG